MAIKGIIGIDEAGRGSWAGPVVASAFCFLKNFKNKKEFILKLKDSKKLTKNKREEIFFQILKLKEKGVLVFGIGIIENDIIDEINIKKANKLAMESALNKLKNNLNSSIEISKILVDGNDGYIFENNSDKTEFIIKGDDKIDEIKAASIIAKVTRDNIMTDFSKKYINFRFDLHKGYGTKKHSIELKNFGPTLIHRKSYKPVKLCGF